MIQLSVSVIVDRVSCLSETDYQNSYNCACLVSQIRQPPTNSMVLGSVLFATGMSVHWIRKVGTGDKLAVDGLVRWPSPDQ
jgi:hypothetical protein